MRVCILTVVHVHDDNRIFFKQIPSLLRAGYRVTYIAPCPSGVQMPEGIDFIPLPRLPRSRRPLNWWRAMRAALRSKADIFHFHDPEFIGPGLLLRMLTHRPVIYDVHENYPQVMLRRRWIPASLRPALAATVGGLERLAIRLFDGIIAANPPTYERFQKRTGRPLALINNYVDLKRFDAAIQATLPLPEPPFFIYTGALSSQRGVLDSLAAFQLLPPGKARLLLVGPLDDADPSVNDLADRLPAGVHLLPAQPFHRLPSLLLSSIGGLVTLHPTPNYLEILPTKLLEYMAASIPVIAYDLPLVRPVLEESGCGILVKSHDIEGLVTAMTYILDHPAEAKEMGKRGRGTVVRYSWEGEERKLLDFYAKILNRSKPLSPIAAGERR
jgi:glycosyltransferase involved in cell wall biosynthesis